MPNQSYLRRLPPEWYRGNAYVHWSISIEKKKSDWLNPLFHAQWRELHLHVLQRYQLVCLAYCLMPDHVHILWKGVHPDSDQRKAMRFFRLHWNALLKPFSLQKQGYDHMLRDKECDADALSDTMRYIFENPVRASLVEERHAWAYAGSLVSGYPDLDARKDFYKFWEIVNRGEG
ncbi:MAG: hypothetical protein ABIP32_07030 [Chthoniobacterales bacterium]